MTRPLLWRRILAKTVPVRFEGVRYRKGDAALDGWSIPHVLAGAGLALLGMRWWWALSVIVLYELLEGGLRRWKPRGRQGLFEFESWTNILVDIVVGAAGFLAFRLLVPWRLLAPFP